MTWINVEEYKNTEADVIATMDVEKNLKVSFEILKVNQFLFIP